MTFTTLIPSNVNFFLPRQHNLPRVRSIVHYRANKNKWALFRHVSVSFPRALRVEYWDVVFCPGHAIIVKKMFLSDHFHVYSVLTFCLALRAHKKNWCGVFAWCLSIGAAGSCVNYFRVDFSSAFFHRKSLSEWIKNIFCCVWKPQLNVR
jgi:hypothetical protein